MSVLLNNAFNSPLQLITH